MEAINSSETLITIYKITWDHNPVHWYLIADVLITFFRYLIYSLKDVFIVELVLLNKCHETSHKLKYVFDTNISWDCYRREIWIPKLMPSLWDKSVLFYELWLYSARGKWVLCIWYRDRICGVGFISHFVSTLLWMHLVLELGTLRDM